LLIYNFLSSQINLECWSKTWECEPGAVPAADRDWLRDDQEHGLFGAVQVYKDINGDYRKRRVLKCDRMWFYPPEYPGFVAGTPPSADQFFQSKIFFWQPVGVWGYSFHCPHTNCPGRNRKDAFLYCNGYHSKLDKSVTLMAGTCGPCNKMAKDSSEDKQGIFLAWDSNIISQLSEAHQALFPATLTLQ